MANQRKRKLSVSEGIDKDAKYAIDDAVKLLKERAVAKFDETVEISMN